MKRTLLYLCLGLATCLVAAEPAVAKGPSEVRVEGVGLAAPLNLDLRNFNLIAEQTGWFALMSSCCPALQAEAPTTNLGPSFTMTWTLPAEGGADEVVQTLYPYAEGGPVTYTRPGQTLYGQPAGGGWAVGDGRLLAALQSAGLPTEQEVLAAIEAAEPPPPAAPVSDDDTSSVPVAWLFGLGLLGAGTLFLVRTRLRRAVPAAAP